MNMIREIDELGIRIGPEMPIASIRCNKRLQVMAI